MAGEEARLTGATPSFDQGYSLGIVKLVEEVRHILPKIGIITDSTANIPEGLRSAYDIRVLPQILIWNGENMYDGVDISPEEFYNRLAASEESPTSSQVTIPMFKEAFKEFVEQDIPVLAILISDRLSGTISSATQAKAMFPDAKIELIDSRTTAMGLGFQVLAAARAALNGHTFEEIVAESRKGTEHSGVYFVVDTLDYLHRGGRIGGAAHLFGSALKMKPILKIEDGQVTSFEKIRTKLKAQARLLEIVEAELEGRSGIHLAALHANAEQEARMLLDHIQMHFDVVEALMTEVSPVVGTHAGPGTVGLAYWTEG